MLKNQQSTKFERKVTSVERFFSRSPYSIVTLVARIKGNVSEVMLKNAVTRVQERHALLRVRINEDQDQGQWFISDEVQGISIEIFPRQADNDWIDIHAEASRIPYDFEARPAIRFILVQSEDISELIILCHHIICDGMSLAYLARDLMVYLADPALDVDDVPAPPIDGNNLPADLSQSGLVKSIINRMNQKWSGESEFFGQEDYQILTKTYWDNYQHDIFSIELSESETSDLVNRCKKEHITVNSALTAAFAGAQLIVEGEADYHKKIVVAASLRDRIPNAPGDGMGMYASAVELKFKYNPRKTLWKNAVDFQKIFQGKFNNKTLFSNILNWLILDPTIIEAMNFKKLGGLVPPESPRFEKLSAFSRKADIVLRLLKQDKLESLQKKHWGTAVTNLGRLDFPTRYGALELDRLILQPGGGIPLVNVNLVLGAVTCAGKLSLVIEYARQAVEGETVERINNCALDLLFGD